MTQVAPGLQPSDPYRNPELFRWLGSLEGVPEWVDPSETPEERAARGSLRTRLNSHFEGLGALLPGLVLASALAWAGVWVSTRTGLALGWSGSPISPILVAIALGLLIRNAIGLPSVYEAGLTLALKKILRIGIALLGIRLSLAAAGQIGQAALPIVVACIASALVAVVAVNRLLGLPRRLGLLIAVGTAICGNTAIVAAAPVVGAKDDEVSYAVGCVTLFGLLALIVHPFVAESLFSGHAEAIGLFLGTAIHDTAQVAGAALVHGEQFGASAVLDTATVTKLLRNLFMLAVIPGIGWYAARGNGGGAGKAPLRQALPLFVFGFLAMTLLRTLGDLGETPLFGVLSAESWQGFIDATSSVARACLIIAMASVGLGTSLRRLRNLGWKPFAVGFFAAALVGAVSAGLIGALR